MDFNIKIGEKLTNLNITEDYIVYDEGENERRIQSEDIIGLEKTNGSYRLYYIKDYPHPDHKLTKEYVEFTTDVTVFTQLNDAVTYNISKVKGRPKKLVVFVNPIAGHGRGKQTCDAVVVPVLQTAGIQTDVVVSENAGYGKQFAETYDFKSVDGLVLMGGDGTVSEVMNVLMRRTQQNANIDFNDQKAPLNSIEFPIAVIPTGSANGVAFLSYGCKDVLTATLHIIKGRRNTYNTVACFNRDKLIGYGFICFGFCFYADLMNSVDNNYRWLRKLRYLFIPVYYVLFKQAREVDVEITYEYLDGSEPEDLTDEERKNHKAIRNKRIINILGTAGDLLAFAEDHDQQSKEQFSVLCYTSCNRFSFLRHMFALQHLTIAELDRVKHFASYNLVSGIGVKVSDSNESEENLIFNIDGETHKLSIPEFYIKFCPETYTVFTSYTKPTNRDKQ